MLAYLTCAISLDTDIRNELSISLDLDSLSVVATALLRMAEDSFARFPMRGTSS